GSASAWCGSRPHGELTALDAPTGPTNGNPYNDNLTQYQGNNSGRQTSPASTSGTDHNFPGYGSQWDQMLYRDVTVATNQAVNISFNYSTNLSDLFNGTHSSQTGYFYFDPLQTVTSCADGNFMSATTATGIADSFMVYVGRP